MSDKQTGLMHKFNVERADGDPESKHTDCRYFVLDPQHDPMAQRALLTYMHQATKQGYIALASDLQSWLKELGVED